MPSGALVLFGKVKMYLRNIAAIAAALAISAAAVAAAAGWEIQLEDPLWSSNDLMRTVLVEEQLKCDDPLTQAPHLCRLEFDAVKKFFDAAHFALKATAIAHQGSKEHEFFLAHAQRLHDKGVRLLDETSKAHKPPPEFMTSGAVQQ
jgi:hypothetical protein